MSTVKETKRTSEIKALVEEEFGEPFWDVIRGFASDGYSKFATSQIIEVHQDTLPRMMKKEGIEIEFAPRYDNVFFNQARKEAPNRKKPHPIGSTKRQEKPKGANVYSLTYRGVADSMAGHARRLGLSYQTVKHRSMKSHDPEYLFRPVAR